MKKILVCLLAAMTAFSVVAMSGCGNSTATSGASGAVSSDSASETESETASETASEAASEESASSASEETSSEAAVDEDMASASGDLEQIIPDEYAPLSQPSDAGYDVSARMGKYTSASSDIRSSGGSQIDVGNASLGYVRVAQSGSDSRLKVQVIKGDKTYNYDLNTNGNFEVFPLQSGDGTYTVRIMKNVSGNKYTMLYSTDINVTLQDSLDPFLYPSQYVNYSSGSAVVKKAAEICSGLKGDVEKVSAVYQWIINNISYDTEKAQSVKTGYLPDPDSTLSSGKGICFDYAALMAAMLRSQGAATKLICGTVSAADLNHAWNEVYLEGTGWVTVKVYFSGNAWERMDPTFGASGGSGIDRYIGDGSNYTGLRVY